MISDYSTDLLRSGIIEAKAGNRDTARRYIDRALYMSSDHDVLAEGWYWMSVLTDDPAEKRKALENCLAHDLRHARARRDLAILDGKLKPEDVINPDAPAPQAQGDVPADAQRFMCPKCGGRMTFSPDGHSLVCEYCATHQKVGATQGTPAGNTPAGNTPAGNAGADKDFILNMATAKGHDRPLAEQVFRCQGCGAQFILPPGQLSATCPYCLSPHVVNFDKSPDLVAPDGIIPHAFDARKAAEVSCSWLEIQLRIAVEHGAHGPLPSPSALPAPRGLYLPVWTFELGGAIDYTGEVLEEETLLGGRRSVRRVTLHDVYPVLYGPLPIPASRKLSAPFVRLLHTFDMNAVEPYDPRYLADWPAELYEIPMDEASLDARSQGFNIIKGQMQTSLAPVKLISTSSARMTVDSFRLNLLPVWVTELAPSAIPGGDAHASHLVLINGKTGDVEGDLGLRKEATGLMGWLDELTQF